MEVTARELARLMELNKKKAEYGFRQAVLGIDCASELRAISANAATIADKVTAAKIEIILPNEKRLQELGQAMAAYPPDSVRECLKIKDGIIYETLSERGAMVKRNHENRTEIAKLSILIFGLKQEERDGLIAAIRTGRVDKEIGLSIQEKPAADIARFMRRCGIPCSASGSKILPSEDATIGEMRVSMTDRSVWISEDLKPKLDENLKKLGQLNTTLQLKNALRQVNNFSDDEEKEFELLQRRYLDLLKEQDELLKDFSEEDKLSVKV